MGSRLEVIDEDLHVEDANEKEIEQDHRKLKEIRRGQQSPTSNLDSSLQSPGFNYDSMESPTSLKIPIQTKQITEDDQFTMDEKVTTTTKS